MITYHQLPHESALVTVQAFDGSWGTTLHSDYSVIATVSSDQQYFYVRDIVRRRLTYVDLKPAVISAYRKYRPAAVYVEEAASGIALLSDLRRSTGIELIGRKPIGSKESRVEVILPLFESGRVLFPRKAPWLDDLISELLKFPNGKFDDQVDALTLALTELRNLVQRSMSPRQRPSLRMFTR